MPAVWRSDLDALQFDLEEGAGQCVVHRLAFRALIPGPPTPETCEAFFQANRRAFESAGRAKAARDALSPGARFHLTSRDIAQALASTPAAPPAVD